MPFWPLSDEGEAILSKMFRLGNRASPASHMNTSIFLQRKDLGNRASPADWAHMKRPLGS